MCYETKSGSKKPALVRTIGMMGALLALAGSPASSEGPAGDEEGFVSLFNGKDLTGWQARRLEKKGYVVEKGCLVCPADGGGFLFSEKEYADFILRLEFKLSKRANNGIAIRSPLVKESPAYEGIEIQVLDDPRYEGQLKPAQYHGSVYDVIPAKRGALKPVGEWNQQEIVCRGRHIRVVLNGETILDADLDKIKDAELLRKHPGLARTKGHIGFLGHGSRVEFRNVRIKELMPPRRKQTSSSPPAR
ncbi:MAG TPA: DUF1080 domain-containing protein [Gemmataceae bacterium]|jgi:hypothetical protein